VEYAPGIVKGLYAILDLDLSSQRGLDPLALAAELLAARPAALQLRAKSAGARDTLALLRELTVRAAPLAVPIFANDRPDLALLAGCAGVHVGRSDLTPSDVRQLAPQLAVGVSTHDLSQLEQALVERPAYIAFGPIFRTSSKHDPEPVVGLTALAHAARRCRAAGIPLVAIGGITRDNLAEVAPHADLIAVISALVPADGLPGVRREAAALQRPWLGA
jgi:thiamine-phosphate pyrophosphorylase